METSSGLWTKALGKGGRGDCLNHDDLEWYQCKANQLKGRFLSKIPYINFEEENILEIGNGPVDMIAFLKGKKRYAVDPLENFFQNNSILTR